MRLAGAGMPGWVRAAHSGAFARIPSSRVRHGKWRRSRGARSLLSRTRFEQASRILTVITDRLARSSVPDLQTFRATLMRWGNEVLAYFRTRSTNGFTNYRLRLLNACA
jgi:transposase